MIRKILGYIGLAGAIACYSEVPRIYENIETKRRKDGFDFPRELSAKEDLTEQKENAPNLRIPKNLRRNEYAELRPVRKRSKLEYSTARLNLNRKAARGPWKAF